MPVSTTPVEQLTYEQAFAELEELVQTLEGDQSALEDALLLYERGQALAQYCAHLLDQADLRVQQIGSLPGASQEDEGS